MSHYNAYASFKTKKSIEKKELIKEIKDDEIDEEEILFDEKPNRKIVLIVLIILFLIALVIGFLIYKKIIKI